MMRDPNSTLGIAKAAWRRAAEQSEAADLQKHQLRELVERLERSERDGSPEAKPSAARTGQSG